jgi:TolB-like protein
LITRFLRELKRRRVLHTASLYIVGAWIALQVVEVLSGAGLPPSTMRNLLVLLSAGFPVSLVTGWFFDISKEGVSKTGPLREGEPLPELRFIDHLLLAGIAVVVVVDAYILSFPPPEDIQLVTTTAPQQRTIAVLGFEDLQPAGVGEDIGEVFAGELRSSLTRTAGLRVLGPETSRVLTDLAGASRMSMAKELSVTAMLLGKVLLDGGRISIDARLVGPAGDEIWLGRVEGPAGDGVALQQSLLRQVVGAVAPGLDPDPVQGPRVEAGECSEVYDIYLRGKRLSQSRKFTQAELWNRGMELLQEAVSVDPQCAVAWEAIATALQNYQDTAGFVRAGVAARRALELNDTLPGAWTVLAEIAEDEVRWNDAEEYILRALRADPTDIQANYDYSFNLVTRGRIREGLDFGLETYRRDPASTPASNVITIAAHYAGDSELMLKHGQISIELTGLRNSYTLDSIAEAHLLRGETDRALETYGEYPWYPDWFPDCVRVRDDPSLVPGVRKSARETLDSILAGETEAGWSNSWRLIRCAIWLEDPDIFYGLLLAEDIETVFGKGFPVEIVFINLWHPDATAMRQDPRFRELVMETGLPDYWKKWGWADLCEPDGDDFRCD